MLHFGTCGPAIAFAGGLDILVVIDGSPNAVVSCFIILLSRLAVGCHAAASLHAR
jgi:hypothetical protein